MSDVDAMLWLVSIVAVMALAGWIARRIVRAEQRDERGGRHAR